MIASASSALLPALLACSWLFLLWHRHQRESLAFWFPVWTLALAAYPLGDILGFASAGTCLLACALATLLAADALLLNTICRWQENGNLAPSPDYTFQFSLGSLMALVLGIATYFSILVLLVNP